MKFEQAFYTRGFNLLNESGTGLGISASSNLQRQFLDNCMNIGAKFNTERSDETAQFVLYSKSFGTFVGVGVSPATNDDGGVVNKLCHFFIPEGKQQEGFVLVQPEDYYLKYPFQRSVEKGSHLNVVELSPCLGAKDYSRILDNYCFNREKLAYFLYKLYPILFEEKNLLLIVLDELHHPKETHADIAREITWLASCLVPGFNEKAVQYRRRLSYSVYSKKNISVVNIAYSVDESLYKNCFYLDKNESIEIPEVYFLLAEKALESNESYMELIHQMLDGMTKNKIDSGNLSILFFQWKIQQEQILTKKELPFNLNQMSKRALCNQKYCTMFKNTILLLDDLSHQDLLVIWKMFVVPKLRDENEANEEKFCKVVERMIVLMYEENQEQYQSFLHELPEELYIRIVEHLYSQKDSCVRKHLDEIKTIDDFKRVTGVYRCLSKNVEYLKQIENTAAACLEAEDILPELKNKFAMYFGHSYREDKNLLNNFRNDIWEKCKTDISSLIFGSKVFGSEQYSIWDVIELGDIGAYEKICHVLEKKLEYGFVETKPLAEEEMKQAELNRIYYCLWKQITKQDDCDVTILSSCDLSAFSKATVSFLEALEEIVKDNKKAAEKVCANYLKLELLKKEISGNIVSNYYNVYEGLLQDVPEIYEKMLKLSPDKYPDIAVRLNDVKIFDRLLKREQDQKQNLEKTALLLYKAKACFGFAAAKVQELEKEFTLNMDKLQKELNEIQDEIKKDEEQISQNKQQIEQLQLENTKLENKININKNTFSDYKKQLDRSRSLQLHGKADENEMLPETEEKNHTNITRPIEDLPAAAQPDQITVSHSIGCADNVPVKPEISETVEDNSKEMDETDTCIHGEKDSPLQEDKEESHLAIQEEARKERNKTILSEKDKEKYCS